MPLLLLLACADARRAPDPDGAPGGSAPSLAANAPAPPPVATNAPVVTTSATAPSARQLPRGTHAPDPVAPFPAHARTRGADCASCHPYQGSAWQTSHHAHAMGQVDPELLRRFDGRPVRAGTLTATPLNEHGVATIRVADATGTHDYAVRATIGVTPLTQMLVAGDRGRLLVAPIAWDRGAGRWFDPSQEGAIGDPADPLYWAGITGTWNHMCAGCHTTGYDEGFDPNTLTYTTRADADVVGCPACHGADANADVRTQAGQIAVCGACHTRGTPVPGAIHPGDPLLDRIIPDLLDGATFASDGGIRAGEEAFEVGPFLQSGMYASGVRCTDCHDPHSGSLRAQGNATCTRCHDAAVWDTPDHAGTAACASCHMPTQTYMGVHVRHDHYVRVPGRDGHGDYAAKDPSAPGVPAFVRASAASASARHPPDAVTTAALVKAARDPDDLVRLAAIRTLASTGAAPDTVAAALADPRRAVRFAALRSDAGTAETRRRVLDEFVAATARSDSPSEWTDLGVLYAIAGRATDAEAALRRALRIDPTFPDAQANLRALLNTPGH